MRCQVRWRRLRLSAHQPINLGPQFGQVSHFQIDAGKTNIGYLVELGQLIEHKIADLVARDFCATQSEQRFFDLTAMSSMVSLLTGRLTAAIWMPDMSF